jgi:2-dehydropantoate 2-reductase
VRYVVIGAGAVGGTIGARLFQAGHDVVLVARGRHLEAIRGTGLVLSTYEESVTLPVPVVSGPEEIRLRDGDVLISAVKSQDTRAVLDTWADVPVGSRGVPASARLPFVVAQNGVANERAALRLFRHVYPVCVWLPASYLEAGTISAEGHPYSGMLTVGKLAGDLDEVTAGMTADLAASRFLAVEDRDVLRWKYGKLLRNLFNSLQAVCGDGPDTDDLRAELRREGEAVLTAAGIPFSTAAQEAAVRGDSVQVKPAPGARRGGSSTWQSLARGTGSLEVDYLNGEIVLLGRLHGVPTPVNEAVQMAAHRVVREGLAPGSVDVASLRLTAPGGGVRP